MHQWVKERNRFLYRYFKNNYPESFDNYLSAYNPINESFFLSGLFYSASIIKKNVESDDFLKNEYWGTDAISIFEFHLRDLFERYYKIYPPKFLKINKMAVEILYYKKHGIFIIKKRVKRWLKKLKS